MGQRSGYSFFCPPVQGLTRLQLKFWHPIVSLYFGDLFQNHMVVGSIQFLVAIGLRCLSNLLLGNTPLIFAGCSQFFIPRYLHWPSNNMVAYVFKANNILSLLFGVSHFREDLNNFLKGSPDKFITSTYLTFTIFWQILGNCFQAVKRSICN